ncbi:MAG TPA: hypothetical protein VFT55_16510 [Planctomycetota bacterium]|nr:hypothetical protein [Planctomycetota bacterium]
MLRTLGIAAVALVVFLLLFVAAFIFNPFEGSMGHLPGIVPRDINFFVRKQRLADDFTQFPEPRFWAALSDARGFSDLVNGSVAQEWRRGGLDRCLQQAREVIESVQTESGGWLDVMRDLIGTEVILAGYEQDYSQSPPRPLAEPWWCCYTRVSWRVKAAFGLAGFGFVQDRLRSHGVDLTSEGDLLVAKLQGMPAPLYCKRHLDVLMIANHKVLLERAQSLLDFSRDEQTIGQMPAYTDGAVKRIEQWAERNRDDLDRADQANVVEFVVEPNAFDGFRRLAASWPNPQNRESMNERVLASFLNLKGWLQVTGGIMFGDQVLAATGQVGLNSKQHTPFQGKFYSAEKQRREDWLDPFLAMVPDSACAAAAMRMHAGEFLHAMFEALEEGEKNQLNESVRKATFKGTPLNDMRHLIDSLSLAFLPRTGFVFRRNLPDTSRDEKTGELMVPVTARSPMPQVAWVFWLSPHGAQLVNELVSMLQSYHRAFGLLKTWNLRVPFADSHLPDLVWEFTNPQIPATGEIAMIVFREFFVLSNSGPLIRDIVRTRYGRQTGVKSARELPEFEAMQRQLPAELNGLIWLHGESMLPVIDDYIAFAEADSALPDQEWMMQGRPAAEEHVRRTRFPQYPSKASMPKSMTEPGGDFDVAVGVYLRELWQRERTNFTAADREAMKQLRALAQMLKAASVHVELENNYIRFQARIMATFR